MVLNQEPYQQLDRVIHEKGRLAIMSVLAATPALSFTEIRSLLGMSDGNLSVHLRTLHEAGYVEVSKSTEQRRALSIYTLSKEGHDAFERYLNLLEEIVLLHHPHKSGNSGTEH